jgi:hypothetical protein
MAVEKPGKKQSKAYRIGSCHLDLAEVRTEAGKLSLCVAIDRACTCAFAEWHAEANNMVAVQFRWHWMADIPDKRHTVLTDHDILSTNRKRDLDALPQSVERIGHAYGLDHRMTTTHHPWSNGHVEQTNRTRRAATVKTYDDQTHHHLKEQWPAFLMA